MSNTVPLRQDQIVVNETSYDQESHDANLPSGNHEAVHLISSGAGAPIALASTNYQVGEELMRYNYRVNVIRWVAISLLIL